MSKQYPNEYNGHRNWDYWNVALWIANDETLYKEAKIIRTWWPNRRDAARGLLRYLRCSPAFGGRGTRTTPDGAKYTQRNLEAALRHIGE